MIQNAATAVLCKASWPGTPGATTHLLSQIILCFLELLLEACENSVLELGGAVEVILALRTLNLQVDALHLALDGLQLLHLLALRLPRFCETLQDRGEGTAGVIKT